MPAVPRRLQRAARLISLTGAYRPPIGAPPKTISETCRPVLPSEIWRIVINRRRGAGSRAGSPRGCCPDARWWPGRRPRGRRPGSPGRSRRARRRPPRRVRRGAVQADGAGLALQAARLAHRRDEERVVRGDRDAEVEVVVASIEQPRCTARWPSRHISAAASIARRSDGVARMAAACWPAISWTLRNSKSMKTWSRSVGRKKPPQRAGAEHALVVRHVQAAAFLGADPADRREDLDSLADHGAAGAQPGGQMVLGRHPVAGLQPSSPISCRICSATRSYPGR